MTLPCGCLEATRPYPLLGKSLICGRKSRNRYLPRTKEFVRTHGDDCAEVDALPPTELRNRVRRAIESHIDKRRWAILQKIEESEKETVRKIGEKLTLE